ncbi:hypothetical protein I5G67_gp103 [Mycobacterium phage Aminay]|uniref:Uncharacterized protein n=1 Tax=Mycobacterium phage Aminay TaxID=2250291 RepID=A0A345KV87_9CAUD|nr:hypothetical protein I5G67_gp103 [Mycobacterium phage Aminay]AXH46939.1 hypothetical protein SEA_AMINAY_103 [Mycobacterium phage Aminay]
MTDSPELHPIPAADEQPLDEGKLRLEQEPATVPPSVHAEPSAHRPEVTTPEPRVDDATAPYRRTDYTPYQP